MDPLAVRNRDSSVRGEPIWLVLRIGVIVGGTVGGYRRQSGTVLRDGIGLFDIRMSTETGSDGVSRVPLDREVGSLCIAKRSGYLDSFSICNPREARTHGLRRRW
jgi:hypothetical protein